MARIGARGLIKTNGKGLVVITGAPDVLGTVGKVQVDSVVGGESQAAAFFDNDRLAQGRRYTGELDGPFCYQEGKAEIMRRMAAEHDWILRDCYAYSDSASDLPMLEAVGHPVAVGPDNELREIA